MKELRWIIILLNLLWVLFLFNSSVLDKEKILKDGTLVLLELAPVDPRSLMQGDYMELNYAIAQGFNRDNSPKRGYCVVSINSDSIAERVRLQKDKKPLHNGEYLIEYTASNWQLKIGAESYFFQEGNAPKYGQAKYGGLKIDKEGNSILVGLYNENRSLIE